MITVCYRKTMNGAKRTVPDTEISLRRPSKREAVVALSQQWNLAHEARKRQDEARKAKAVALGLPKDAPTTVVEQEQARIVRQDTEAVKERTRALVPNDTDRKYAVRWIVNRVAQENGVLPEVIFSESRNRFYVAVRHHAIVRVYLAFPNMSLPWIGRQFGRDHTTILHALVQSGQWQRREVT
jgi:hypothetical protein